MKPQITQEYLKERLDYDPVSGLFWWKAIPELTKESRRWNTRYAGKQAGSKTPEGYVLLLLEKYRWRAHVLAWFYMYGEFPSKEIDHRNRVKNDNSLDNLRLADRSENTQNYPRKNSTGFRGVSATTSGKYMANVRKNGKIKYLGSYETAEEASEKYIKAAIEIYGDFASLD